MLGTLATLYGCLEPPSTAPTREALAAATDDEAIWAAEAAALEAAEAEKKRRLEKRRGLLRRALKWQERALYQELGDAPGVAVCAMDLANTEAELGNVQG